MVKKEEMLDSFKGIYNAKSTRGGAALEPRDIRHSAKIK